MTANEFNAECGERLLPPGLVLENDAIRQALADRNDDKVKELLDSEF